MANNKVSKSANNQTQKNNRPPKTIKNNNKEYEFNSYNDSIMYSDYYFGFNLFNYYTPEQLAAIIQDPMNNNQILRDISLILYGTNGVFTNTVDYMVAMPTLDKVIVPHGNSPQKKRRNKDLMESTLRTIKDKEIIRDALWKGMVEGVAFYYFETTARPKSNKKYMTYSDVESVVEINDIGVNASIISLPVDYTKIVGIQNSSYVIAFNLDYFTIGGVEPTEQKLRKYPKEIREAWHNKKSNRNIDGGNWVVLDNTKTIVHKIRSKRDEKYGRPLVLAAINDILYGDYFTKTKRGVLDFINSRVIYETFPEGSQKGTSALTKQQQQAQHDAVKGAIMNPNGKKGVSFFSVAAGTKIDSIKAADTDIFDNKYESNLNDKISLDMGIAASLLNGSGSGNYSSQQSNLELVTSQVMMWVEQIQSELNKCISANIIKDDKNWVECKYLPITHVNKGQMVGYAKDLYLQGKGSLSLWASACGISPDVFFALLDQELEENIETKYPVHMTSFVYSAKNDNKGGRPETDDPSENTIRSRNSNGNATPTPSDKE